MGKYQIFRGYESEKSTHEECKGYWKAIVWRGDVLEKTLLNKFNGIEDIHTKDLDPLK